MRKPPPRAFTLPELLITVAILGLLVALVAGASLHGLTEVKKTDSSARLRTLGQAVLAYVADNEGKLPGPLWPGQVLQYDPDRDGRIVRDLGPYLGIEQRTTPYLVDSLFPKAYRAQMPPGSPADARVYLMNPGWTEAGGQTTAPFGSLTVTPNLPALKLVQLTSLNDPTRWMIAEADQQQSYVSTAPWKNNTPSHPLHDGYRAEVRFDGSAIFEKAD